MSGKWRYDIQYGPEGEEAYAWLYDDSGEMVGTTRTYQALKIVRNMNKDAGLIDQQAVVISELVEALERLRGECMGVVPHCSDFVDSAIAKARP